eukprot:CAMPEP_0174848806 /NCGR_PEP_ID=MMETSP1114-20130205/13743_1 /TAXON_ID=312471 /ORGANISM="Neobodo designis, Strain CCAP 1951/1" /LENGTH=308 /DNA_ID=CAMNT_0016083111 /DNA_START=57 /DNA_END=979 /DNA_ORIENTATION=+
MTHSIASQCEAVDIDTGVDAMINDTAKDMAEQLSALSAKAGKRTKFARTWDDIALSLRFRVMLAMRWQQAAKATFKTGEIALMTELTPAMVAEIVCVAAVLADIRGVPIVKLTDNVALLTFHKFRGALGLEIAELPAWRTAVQESLIAAEVQTAVSPPAYRPDGTEDLAHAADPQERGHAGGALQCTNDDTGAAATSSGQAAVGKVPAVLANRCRCVTIAIEATRTLASVKHLDDPNDPDAAAMEKDGDLQPHLRLGGIVGSIAPASLANVIYVPPHLWHRDRVAAPPGDARPAAAAGAPFPRVDDEL